MKSKKENVLVDEKVEIDEKLYKKLDKKIRADKQIPKEEILLWESAHILPNKYCEKIVEFLKKL